jgi:hypothetical protein
VFIVVMVVTLLTAIGLYAIRAASMTNVATGNLRQHMQTSQLAEYATRLNVIVTLSDPETTGVTLRIGDRTPDAGGDQCYVNRSVDSTGTTPPSCRMEDGDDFVERIAAFDPNMTFLETQTATSPGSFGPPLTAAGDLTSVLEGRIRVEMHERFEGVGGSPPPGAGLGTQARFSPSTLVLTTFAQIRMTGAGTALWCPDPVAGPSASMQAMRAYVTLPITTTN